MVMAQCAMMLLHTAKDYDWGMAVIESAVEANPNSLAVVFRAGIAHLHCGNIEDALAYFHRARRLSPRDPGAHFSLTGIAHAQMILGNYSEALVWAARSRAVNSNFHPTYWMLIAANAHLGHTEEAHRFLQEFRKIAPDITIARIRAGQPAKDPTRLAAILDGLRLAGLEEIRQPPRPGSSECPKWVTKPLVLVASGSGLRDQWRRCALVAGGDLVYRDLARRRRPVRVIEACLDVVAEADAAVLPDHHQHAVPEGGDRRRVLAADDRNIDLELWAEQGWRGHFGHLAGGQFHGANSAMPR